MNPTNKQSEKPIISFRMLEDWSIDVTYEDGTTENIQPVEEAN